LLNKAAVVQKLLAAVSIGVELDNRDDVDGATVLVHDGLEGLVSSGKDLMA
jgi:hypothetical protein